MISWWAVSRHERIRRKPLDDGVSHVCRHELVAFVHQRFGVVPYGRRLGQRAKGIEGGQASRGVLSLQDGVQLQHQFVAQLLLFAFGLFGGRLLCQLVCRFY